MRIPYSLSFAAFVTSVLCATIQGIAQTYPATTYRAEVTEAVLEAKTIDEDNPVGAIPASHTVDMMGGANVSIPIQVPPGTNGMVPNLALQYNSRGGNGALGIGWGLSGLSAITRTGSNDFQDGEVAPIQFTLADHFLLDGQRLVATNSGIYGENGTEYDTEQATFSNITSQGNYGSLGGGPEYFTMITKDGMRMEFGGTAASRQILTVRIGDDIDPTDHVAVWNLSKIQDPFGNYITFLYPCIFCRSACC